MDRLPSTLATHPPLARLDVAPDPGSSRPLPDPAVCSPPAPPGRVDLPCHLPIAWAARRDLDHPPLRRPA